MYYITLEELKQNIRLGNFTTDDKLLMNWIAKSSRLIDFWKDRRYDVYKDTVLLNCPHHNPALGGYLGNTVQNFGTFTNGLRLPGVDDELFLDTSKLDLVDVISITNGDGIDISLDDCIIYKVHGFIIRIFLKNSSGVQWQFKDDEWRNAITLVGYMGFAVNYPDCYINSGENLSGSLLDTATTLNVTDVAGVADDLISPRFQTGMVLRLNSNTGIEFILIKSITTNTLSLVRGYNGTIAVTHPIYTPIEIFRVDDIASQMCLRLVQWRYRQKDSDSFDRTFNLATQTATTPSALPSDVRMILGRKGKFNI